MSPQAQWLTPSPLWNEFAPGADKGPFRGPALLRFSTDQFMEELQALLVSKTPENLRNYVAQAETWRSPAVGLGAVGSSTVSISAPATGQVGKEQQAPPPFKFFQPVHARFYLVSASLVCRVPGLPDHQVRTNQAERTSFVLRRLRPKTGVTGACSTFDPQHCDEYAWIASDKSGWSRVGGTGLADGEEKLPLFPLQVGTNGTRRRMFSGLIPVSRRQTYVAGRDVTAQTQGSADPTDDPRKIDFQRQVLDPWVELVDYNDEAQASNPPLPASAMSQMATGIAQGSALILIDFANYLAQNLPKVWAAVQDASQATGLGVNQLALFNALGATVANLPPATSRSTIVNAIKTAKSFESTFESAVLASGSNPPVPSGYPGPLLSDTSDTKLSALIRRGNDPLQPRALQVLAEAALDEVGQAPPATVRTPAKDPENPQGDDWYIVRCVYEQPHCGLKAAPVMSVPSQPFQLASFFDFDAPARPLQVALPIDTTPAALRKYDKGVAFMISDQLGKQLSRVKGLKQLMDGDLADPNGLGLGMICSLSIPIITICAFIVLMIFLVLLNLIFWWLPFFKICFPIPTLKAKG